METCIEISDDDNGGYFMEPHEIITEDGYILTLLRVQKGKRPINKSHAEKSEKMENNPVEPAKLQEGPPKPVVLVVHGFLCSSEEWLINSSEKVLPYRLINEGYDCWLANLRGTPLSRGHVDIPKGSRKYWDFSFHDMAIHDVPAMINFVLDTTGNTSLTYIGHSMGCAVLTLCLSLHPEFNSKVKILIALAPAIYLKHIRNKFFRFVAHFGKIVGDSKFLRTRPLSRKSTRYYADRVCFSSPSNCKGRAEKLANWCLKHPFVWLGAFGSGGQIDEKQLTEVAKVFPAATSTKLYCHGIQTFFSGEPRQYDYGRSQNFKMYGQATPPLYDFSNVKIPVAAISSESDELCPPKAVGQFVSELPNVIGHYIINQPKFSHVDFLLGKDADKLIYDQVLELVRKTKSPSANVHEECFMPYDENNV